MLCEQVNCTSDLPNSLEGDPRVAYFRFEAWRGGIAFSMILHAAWCLMLWCLRVSCSF